MGLWGSFGRSFQKENTTRTIRTIRTIADSDTRKSNSAYSASSAYIDTNLKKAQQGEVPAKVEAFTLPEPIEEPKADAWPDFQREAVPARYGYPLMPDEKDAQAGRERLKSDVAEVRARFRRPPLQYPDGPDWFAFCGGYPTGCDDCRYYARDKACWCRLWEACFPGAVHWYDWPE